VVSGYRTFEQSSPKEKPSLRGWLLAKPKLPSRSWVNTPLSFPQKPKGKEKTPKESVSLIGKPLSKKTTNKSVRLLGGKKIPPVSLIGKRIMRLGNLRVRRRWKEYWHPSIIYDNGIGGSYPFFWGFPFRVWAFHKSLSDFLCPFVYFHVVWGLSKFHSIHILTNISPYMYMLITLSHSLRAEKDKGFLHRILLFVFRTRSVACRLSFLLKERCGLITQQPSIRLEGILP